MLSDEIYEMVLFIHPKSQNSRNTLNLIRQNNLQVKIFNIVSKHIARSLKKGKYFNITKVPTLVVAFKDGNLKKFEGEKCNEFINYYLEQESYDDNEILDSDIDDDYIDDGNFDDDELLEEPSSLEGDNGRINISEAIKRNEHAREELDKRLMPQDMKIRKQII